jgi:pyruvate/2-oxoacid:ferredoxin oxidoreductase alpha subunit
MFINLRIESLEDLLEHSKKELSRAKNIIIVENNSTAQLASLIASKTGIFIDDKNKILRFDGRPFLSDELKDEIERRIK